MLNSWASAQAQPPVVQASGYPNTRLADQELGVVIDALYGFIEHNRRALQLFARCAADLPELAQWYFAQRRRATLDQLGGYLRQQTAAGNLRPVPDIPAAARFIVEPSRGSQCTGMAIPTRECSMTPHAARPSFICC